LWHIAFIALVKAALLLLLLLLLLFGLQGNVCCFLTQPAMSVLVKSAAWKVLTRTASSCLASFTCMELGLLIAGLADLHWRPSELWMRVGATSVVCWTGWGSPGALAAPCCPR
jgi:hypothetical protein